MLDIKQRITHKIQNINLTIYILFFALQHIFQFLFHFLQKIKLTKSIDCIKLFINIYN